MWNKIMIALVLTLFLSNSAMAQSAFFDRKQLTTDAARIIVDTCLAFAAERDTVVGVAVVDMSGVLMDFHVMQAGGPITAESAILKAKTAAHWGRPTTALEEAVMSGGNQASVWVNDFPKGGGIPIVVDGKVAGAVGVGGPQFQDECAQAGIDAVLSQ